MAEPWYVLLSQMELSTPNGGTMTETNLAATGAQLLEIPKRGYLGRSRSAGSHDGSLTRATTRTSLPLRAFQSSSVAKVKNVALYFKALSLAMLRDERCLHLRRHRNEDSILHQNCAGFVRATS
jgi:hypothetical protein